MNEAETRAKLIDPQLKESGWGVVEGTKVQLEYPITAGRIKSGRIRQMTITVGVSPITQARVAKDYALSDAIALFGSTEKILSTFIEFQKHLNQRPAA